MLKTKSIIATFVVLFLFPAVIFASVAGSLDKRFDTDGKLTIPNAGSSLARDAAVQPDGKIVVVGQSDGDFFVVRLNKDGSLDTTFDSDGKTDPVVFRPSTVTWFISRTSDGGTTIATFGGGGVFMKCE